MLFVVCKDVLTVVVSVAACTDTGVGPTTTSVPASVVAIQKGMVWSIQYLLYLRLIMLLLPFAHSSHYGIDVAPIKPFFCMI